MNKIILSSVFFSILGSSVYAQKEYNRIINTGGGTATINGITYEYAIGEGIITTFNNAGIYVTQGFLQPGAGFENSSDVLAQSDLQLFPNPASQEVYLQPSFARSGKLIYQLFDMTGRLLYEKSIVLQTGNERQTIPLSQFAAGQYMLGVQWIPSAGAVRNTSYKIQKVQ